MSKSLLTVLTTAFALLTGVSYAAEICSDEQNEAYSFVFDLDRKIVSSSMKTGDVMPLTRVTVSQILVRKQRLSRHLLGGDVAEPR